MNIRNEKLTELTQKLTIEIVKDDYAVQVENALKKQRQKAVVPGFRIGNAPMGLVKKMYYKSILFDHLNHTIEEQLSGYLKDNNISVLLEPLPTDNETEIDLDNQDDFTFTFEYALYPQIELEWDKLPAVKRFTIKASETEIDEYTAKLRERHGKYINAESICFEDDFVSVSYDGNKKGYFHFHTLSQEGKALLKDKKLKEEVEISFVPAFNTIKDLIRFLKIEEQDLEDGNSYTYTITIESIGRIEPAAYDEEFFQKAFPDGNVKNKEELRKLAAEEIEKQWAVETSKYFMDDAINIILEHVNIALPDDFIKRYVLMTQKDMTAEKLEQQYPKMAKAFRWQLIEKKLATENDIAVTKEDIKNHIRNFFITNYFAQFNLEDIKDHLDKQVNEAMKNEKEVRQIYDTLFDENMATLLVNKMKLDEQSGDFEAFINTIKEKEAPVQEPPKKKTVRKSAKKEIQNAENEEVKEEEIKEKEVKEEEVKEPVTEENAPKPKATRKKSTKKEE